jgi:hypothetical protein
LNVMRVSNMLYRVYSAIFERRLLSGLLRRRKVALDALSETSDALRENWLRKVLRQGRARTPVHWTLHRESILGDHLKAAFADADQNKINLPGYVREIEGMSGQKYRGLVNQLVTSMPDARYLEIGSWAGSTACAALSGNNARALCIDNWSQFGGPRDQFFKNIENVRPGRKGFEFLESDFRQVNFANIGRFNIFLFDGPHAEPDQYDGIMLALPALEPQFVLIVDDWNWPAVRLGTFTALIDARMKIDVSVEIRTTFDNTHATIAGWESDWHNGYFIGAISRRYQRLTGQIRASGDFFAKRTRLPLRRLERR